MPASDAEVEFVDSMTDEELKRLLDGAVGEMRRHFDVSLERVRDEGRLVAEGLTAVGQKLDRTGSDMREEMRRGFAETQSMIKFSHVELDRRVQKLEENLAELQTRVERLESGTH